MTEINLGNFDYPEDAVEHYIENKGITKDEATVIDICNLGSANGKLAEMLRNRQAALEYLDGEYTALSKDYDRLYNEMLKERKAYKEQIAALEEELEKLRNHTCTCGKCAHKPENNEGTTNETD